MANAIRRRRTSGGSRKVTPGTPPSSGKKVPASSPSSVNINEEKNSFSEKTLSYIAKVNEANFSRLEKAVVAAEIQHTPTKRVSSRSSRPSRQAVNEKAFQVAEALSIFTRRVDIRKSALLPELKVDSHKGIKNMNRISANGSNNEKKEKHSVGEGTNSVEIKEMDENIPKESHVDDVMDGELAAGVIGDWDKELKLFETDEENKKCSPLHQQKDEKEINETKNTQRSDNEMNKVVDDASDLNTKGPKTEPHDSSPIPTISTQEGEDDQVPSEDLSTEISSTPKSSKNAKNDDAEKVDDNISQSETVADKLVSRAKHLLAKWRKGVGIEDTLCCPDYIDEYECDDETRKWVKLYPCTVLGYATGQGNTSVKIALGDSSDKHKSFYYLKEDESAIHVHYHNFPSSHDRWLLLTDKNSEHIMPDKSTHRSVQALKKLLRNQAIEKKEKEPETVTNIVAKGKLNKKNSRKVVTSLPVSPSENDTPVDSSDEKETVEASPKKQKRKQKGENETPAKKKAKLKKGSKNVADETEDKAQSEEMERATERNERSSETSKRKKKDEANEVQKEHENKEHSDIPSSKNSNMDKPEKNNEKDVTLKNDSRQKKGKKNPKDTPSKKKERKSVKPATEVNGVLDISSKDEKESFDESKSLDFTWICVVCKEAECAIDSDSPLLLCEGPCERAFHYPCAGLVSVPPQDQVWICTDCTQKRHQCAACGHYGQDNVEVFKCERKKCGLFFHEGCLSMYNVDVDIVMADGEGVPRFSCPAHVCWTCSGDMPIMRSHPSKEKKRSSKANENMGSQKKGELFRCLNCPNSYHVSCIPPKARFHELALLCHECANKCKLPDLDMDSSMQAEVEADAEKKLEQIRRKKRSGMNKNGAGKKTSSSNLSIPNWFKPPSKTCIPVTGPVIKGSETAACDFYRLPNDFREEVHSRLPTYTHVHSLKYDPNNRPKRLPPNQGTCNCKPTPDDSLKISCGENCLNRHSMIECIGDSSTKTTNAYTNCNCGPNCGNRLLGQRKFAKCRPKRQNGRGWGLTAVKDVKVGELVQEYVGEVIDEQEKKTRLDKWSVDNPHDPNFYVMSLDQGYYIDAREKGNLSRFINHSCDPNCKLVRVNVAGFTRVAIVCIRDVEAGEFFSYDYQFDTKDGDKFVCLCGAENCRGTMKGGVNNASDNSLASKKSSKELRSEALSRFERDQKFLEQVEKEEKTRLNEVGVLVPGESVDDSNTVAKGPQEKDKSDAQKYRIFLWRSALLGADFDARYKRKTDGHRSKKAKKEESRRKNMKKLCSSNVDVVSILEKD